MKKKSWILWVVVLAALVAVVLVARSRIQFRWDVFLEQLKLADWSRIAVGIGLIWVAYCLRAVRWSIFLKPTKRVSPFKLFGSMVIGFTGVALFGRLADLVRPYLVSRRTQIPLSAQIAVYTVERMFDMGAMALIFSTVLLFSPERHTLPRPDLINKAALGGLLVAVFLALFTVFVRVSGKVVARALGRTFGALSARLGEGEGSGLSRRLNAVGPWASAAGGGNLADPLGRVPLPILKLRARLLRSRSWKAPGTIMLMAATWAARCRAVVG